MKRTQRIGLFTLLSAMLVACGGAATPAAMPTSAPAATAAPAATEAAAYPDASNGGAVKGVGDVVPPIARMVIRNATLTLVVRDTHTQLNTVMRMADEQQLRDILARATQTEDVLKVFEQLKNVRGQIEQAKGRMQYLSQSAALATITLTMLSDKPALPVEAPGWRPEGVAKTALEKLIGSLQGLVDVGIWTAIYVLPMLAVVLVPIFIGAWLLRLRSRRRNRGATAAP